MAPRKPVDRFAFLVDKTAKQRSEKQEKRLARETGGRKQPASGSTIGRHGDVDRVPEPEVEEGRLRIEAKTTKHDSYRLHITELHKIEEQAAVAGKLGAMIISFGDKEDYFVIRKDFLKFGGGKHGRKKTGKFG